MSAVRIVRAVGWLLVSAGVLVLLYLVYSLGFTNLEAQRGQQELRREFELHTAQTRTQPGARPGQGRGELPARSGDDRAPPPPAPPTPSPGGAYAALWFERPGSDRPLVHDDPLFVVEGVSLDVLRRGPGHYPDSAAPGGAGNFAVAGHRTTYGAPFFHLDQLRAGDEVHVVDRSGSRWVYRVVEQRVVAPTELWVVGSDPLGTGLPTLTLTTCTPRFSAAQRLVVFAELEVG